MTAAPEAMPVSGPSVWGSAVVGRRANQEDAYRAEYLAEPGAWLLVMCDGMGGHAAGAVASQVACESFRDACAAALEGGVPPPRALDAGLAAANAGVAAYQKGAPETRGMGTTLVGALVGPRGVWWISVGDSPLWLLRGGRLERLNEDHSLRGIEAEINVSRNVLQSAVTGGDIAMVDAPEAPRDLSPGDIVVLASDGVLTLEEDEIAALVADAAPRGAQETVKTLLAEVMRRDAPHQDNCSIIVLAVPGRPGLIDRMRRMFAGLAAAALPLAALPPP